MKVRPATMADALDVLAWRNDPLTRAMSRNQAEVAEAEHLAWFGRALENPNLLLLIGEADGEKAGMVRLDFRAETEVSINVNPALRGRGYGQALLQAGVREAAGSVVAEIRDENVASRRLFERAGFRRVATANGVGRYVLER